MLLKIIFLLLLSLMMLIPSKHALHMFQQNRYELRRYGKWLNDNVSKKTLLTLIVALVLMIGGYMFLHGILVYLGFGLMIVLAAYDYWRETKKSYIKPLVYTARVKRQIVVLAILDLLLIGSIVWFVALDDLAGLIIIAYVL
ncbi:MAG: hypothetical protein MR210_06730, partial [Erysipelotrichaceae bacterium]|nr:hypothetical protein [Erysipelotrichaceae bacterium]